MTPLRSLTTFVFLCGAALLLAASAGALDPGDIDPYIQSTDGPTQCNDAVDNDGDGLNNLEDPGCRNRHDDLENPQCDDTFDNDGDLTADFAGSGLMDPDADCETAWWDHEGYSRSSTGHPADGHGGVTDGDVAAGRTECGDIFGGPALLVPALVWMRRRRTKK